MFTGIVREIGVLRSVVRLGQVTRLVVSAPACAAGLAPGDSLAVNGICLTVAIRRKDRLTLEAVAETRRVTTLGSWRAGDRVHLEPALRAGEPLGGHYVLGHVDGTGKVLRNGPCRGAWQLTVGLPPRLAREMVAKGSIAVNGVSLTLDDGSLADRFTASLVPLTLAATRLGELRPGQAVNVEMDALAKAARRAAAPEMGDEAGPRSTLGALLARDFGRGGSAWPTK